MKFKNKFSVASLVFVYILLVGISLAQAEVWLEPMFGPEFTFTNSELIEAGNLAGSNRINTPQNRNAQLAWRSLMEKRCLASQDCVVLEKFDHYGSKVFQITYTDGFHYTVSIDPHVVELQMKPLTIPETLANRDRIQTDIFEVAKELGLSAHDYYGGGSIHIDKRSGFANDAMLFLDFFIDYSNHYTLSTRCMGEYLDNAPPVLALPEKNVTALRGIIHEARQEALKQQKDGSGGQTISDIAQKIRREVYSTSYYSNFRPTQKYQALNLDKMAAKDESYHTVEVRGIRAQRNVDEYINVLRIFRARINFLNLRRKHHQPDVELLRKVADQFPEQTIADNVVWFRDEHSRSAAQYRRYVTQTGLDWSTFRNVVPEELFCESETSHFSGEDCIQKANPTPPKQLVKDLLKIKSKL